VKLSHAIEVAESIKAQIAPFCEQLEIAGSICRKKPECGDIDLVVTPKQTELFQPGIESVIDQWEIVKGVYPCKYTQRILPSGEKIEIHFADKINFGFIHFIRIGSAEFSHDMAKAWARLGYHGVDGHLSKNGIIRPVMDEEEIFQICGRAYIKPEFRI
jgi:DNA polymerase/3'-5' exonuclease PolX